MKLKAHSVEKPWGRTELPSIFASQRGKRIGEIWFTADTDVPLMPKYLFTSENLSVQVHPDDEGARARGFSRGKAECWYVVDAEPEARIGIGLCCELTGEQLRDAAIDGSIMEAIDWRLVGTGDFLYVPAGTIHAIGAGIALLEFQQNSDVTFRLYDYGRPRELHLDDAVGVSTLDAYPGNLMQHVGAQKDVVLVDGPEFTLIHTHADELHDRRRWILPLDGIVRSGGDTAGAGECLLLEPGDALEVQDARMLIGAEVG